MVQDLCASGGYYVAVGAERIYVDKASLVGSIGVIIGGFGFTGAMDKLGIERRAYTAGANKDFLDPFAPEDPVQRAHAQKMLDEIHRQFIQVVREGRGARLKESPGHLLRARLDRREERRARARGRLRQRPDYVARDVIKAEQGGRLHARGQLPRDACRGASGRASARRSGSRRSDPPRRPLELR